MDELEYFLRIAPDDVVKNIRECLVADPFVCARLVEIITDSHPNLD